VWRRLGRRREGPAARARAEEHYETARHHTPATTARPLAQSVTGDIALSVFVRQIEDR
jgi:hypothetical protein